MAEIATIARPYAEALFKAVGHQDAALGNALQALAQVAGEPQVRQIADSPKATTSVVFNVISDVLGRVGVVLPEPLRNLLTLLLDNGRLAALPEIASQYRALANGAAGVSDARIETAFPLEAAQLSDLQAMLEARFKRKLTPQVVVNEGLIGGVRVTVGDEVLDTSVQARLEQMKTALTA